ncbi:hypothetical protein IKE71_00485 [Candidatus Saccharibacteria bacterium]|nr:hypothetical protein [Candidatus Saccharibacteria bacterium]
MSKQKKIQSPVLKMAGIFMVVKGLFCFMTIVGIEFSYASRGTIGDAASYFFVANLIYPFSIFVGLYLGGAFLGSNRTKFIDKLKKADGAINQKTERKVVMTSPEAEGVSPRLATFLILIDLAASFGINFFIPEVPKFYFLHGIEAVALFVVAREMFKD